MNTPTHSHAQCQELFARLSEYLDNELDPMVCEHVERHLRDCAPCQVCLATLKRTIDLCRYAQVQTPRSDFSRYLLEWIERLGQPRPKPFED